MEWQHESSNSLGENFHSAQILGEDSIPDGVGHFGFCRQCGNAAREQVPQAPLSWCSQKIWFIQKVQRRGRGEKSQGTIIKWRKNSSGGLQRDLYSKVLMLLNQSDDRHCLILANQMTGNAWYWAWAFLVHQRECSINFITYLHCKDNGTSKGIIIKEAMICKNILSSTKHFEEFQTLRLELASIPKKLIG